MSSSSSSAVSMSYPQRALTEALVDYLNSVFSVPVRGGWSDQEPAMQFIVVEVSNPEPIHVPCRIWKTDAVFHLMTELDSDQMADREALRKELFDTLFDIRFKANVNEFAQHCRLDGIVYPGNQPEFEYNANFSGDSFMLTIHFATPIPTQGA